MSGNRNTANDIRAPAGAVANKRSREAARDRVSPSVDLAGGAVSRARNYLPPERGSLLDSSIHQEQHVEPSGGEALETTCKPFHEREDLTGSEINKGMQLYSRLFGNFGLSFHDVLDITSDPDAVNGLLKNRDEVTGFYSGVPLKKFDLIPENARGVIGFLMPKAFTVLAVGVDDRLPPRERAETMLEGFNDLLKRVRESGYKSIYVLARKADDNGNNNMDGLLRGKAGARKLWTFKDFVPGEDFTLLRIGRLNKLQGTVSEQLTRLKRRRS